MSTHFVIEALRYTSQATARPQRPRPRPSRTGRWLAVALLGHSARRSDRRGSPAAPRPDVALRGQQ
jgi:hypothetical protein